MAAAAQSRPLGPATRGQLTAWAPTAAVLLIGLVLTALATAVVSNIVRTKDRDRFNHSVEQTQEAVAGRLDTYIALLRAGAGFAGALDAPLDREGFRRFVARLDLDRRYPGIQGIGFSARLQGTTAQDAERSLAAWGAGEVRVRPREPRGEYHAIVHLEPMDRRNRAALGYDMYSEPTRRLAMEQARDTGGAAASGKVQLIQEIDEVKQSGFLIYAPVYRGGLIPPTVEARRAALEGFVYSPFRADDLMANVFGADRARVHVDVYDGPAEAANLLHRSPGARASKPEFAAERTLDIAGRTWTLRYIATPALMSTSGRAVVPFVFWGGFLASVLLALVVTAQTRSRLQAQAAATAQAQAAAENARLFQSAQDELAARTEAERHQRLLLDELNHRVKNTLATVQSIAAQTFRATPDPRDFRQAFEGRLVALSGAHNLLSQANWRGVTLTDLVKRELAPHGLDDLGRIALDGEPEWLSPSAAVAIGMALHELATNASKHGALSTAQGKVAIRWHVEPFEDERLLRLVWQESGGPRVEAPRRRGFGSRMIEQGLRHELRGQATLHFEPEGLRCDIEATLPAAQTSD